MTTKYQTKISYGMLTVIFLLFFLPVLFGIINNGITSEFYVLLGILIPSYAFIVYLFFNTEYRIENNELIIKCGFLFEQKIDIKEIKTLKKTTNLISSPAPSFDRIEIKYGKFDEVLISLKDKVSFAKDLTKINPKIENNITVN
jgi:hypothetical protein